MKSKDAFSQEAGLQEADCAEDPRSSAQLLTVVEEVYSASNRMLIVEETSSTHANWCA